MLDAAAVKPAHARGRALVRLAAVVVFPVASVALSGCGPQRCNPGPELMVFAAASLTDAFEALEADFESAHPEVDVRMVFAGSQILRLQIEQGARADVFASANADHMHALADAQLVETPQAFALNELVVIVPGSADGPVRTFADLGSAERIVLGTDNVPIGQYTERLLNAAEADPALGPTFTSGVRSRVVSRETNVRLVRSKVALGVADAAIVYRTDAVERDDVRAVEVPPSINVTASYPIAVLRDAKQPELARMFIEHVRGPAGRRILQTHGFRPPDPAEASPK